MAEHVDAKLFPEHAGFRPGKSCTSQLTEPDGLHRRWLREAHDHWCCLRGLVYCLRHGQPLRHLSKVLEMTGDVHLTDLIRLMPESRRFFVILNGKKSRWRRQRNGLSQEEYWHRCCSTSPTTSPYTPTLAASSTQTTYASRRKETTSTTSKHHSRLP